ncbi:MAG TPA: MgtC/SapB family protein [Gemmataceae bacterium]|nr:MgtC/SapB family protein [Gemmataceae bacterium]
MSEVFQAIAGEFADLTAVQFAKFAVRLVLAGGLAALLGWERWRAGKSAGIRTHVLVGLGAAGFAAVPLQAGAGPDGVSRVLQGVAAGIGFLGAGCIMKHEGETVHGLTTAAGIWLTAVVGISAGLGRCGSAILLAAAGLFTLSVLGRWEHSTWSGTGHRPV